MVHAELEHAEARIARHAGEGERHAPVVVADCRRWHRSAPAAASAERSASLVLVLPTLPVTATNFAAVRRARGAAEIAPARSWCRRPRSSGASAGRSAGSGATTSAPAAPRCQRGGDEVVAVEVRPLQRDEQIARLDACGCRSTRRSRRPVALAALPVPHGGGDLGGGPERRLIAPAVIRPRRPVRPRSGAPPRRRRTDSVLSPTI